MQYASELPDFADLVRAVAQSRRIAPAIIEKDYFLIRVLNGLANNHRELFLLKGGTSLSKGWDLLDRFSEDIDLLLKIEFDGKPISKGERERRMKQICSTVAATVDFTQTEGKYPAERCVHRTAEFSYRTFVEDLTGLGKTVKLEIGTRGGVHPTATRTVHSFLTRYIQEKGLADLAEDLSGFELEMLDVKRTFVEKLFAVEGAFVENRAANRTRHYYDLYKLCELSEIQDFAGTAEYCEISADVERYSREHFPNTSLPQPAELARSEAFNPKADDLRALERHYREERHLFFVEPPPFAKILERIHTLRPRL